MVKPVKPFPGGVITGSCVFDTPLGPGYKAHSEYGICFSGWSLRFGDKNRVNRKIGFEGDMPGRKVECSIIRNEQTGSYFTRKSSPVRLKIREIC